MGYKAASAGSRVYVHGLLHTGDRAWNGGTGKTILYTDGMISVGGTVSSLSTLEAQPGGTLVFTPGGGRTVITCTPEPTTALLLLGAVPLLRRRRRV